ncbi:MAG: 23S rRNA (uracil(1939)-C(5))-methyltransferase RlmD [Eubacteriales bacterium]|nr:23S rRNA (uracil(1939)-C(5))-methyltransferase RlmD [Eubacteriales bacterium]
MKELSAPVRKNQDITLTIDSLGSDAQGIGRYDGFVVFVPGALPAETVEAHIIKVTASYAVAKLVRILAGSAQRVAPPCPYFGLCGGCSLQHLSYEGQVAEKQRMLSDVLTRVGGVQSDVIRPMIAAQDPWHYRNKGAFPAGMDGAVPVMGLYAQRSHRIIPIEDCLIQQKAIVDILRCVQEWAREHHICAYDENTNTGNLRHVVIRCNEKEDAAAVTLVTREKTLPMFDDLIERLRAHTCAVCLVQNINPRATNVIFGAHSTTLWGEAEQCVALNERRFVVSDLSFFQVNYPQTVRLYDTVRDFAALDGSQTLLDAYCGVGSIGQYLADACREVIGFEIVPQAVENARSNALLNGLTNCRYELGDADELLEKLVQTTPADVIVVDPPRKGVGAPFIRAAKQSGAQRIVYVSCNPGTLARDISLLRQEAGYRVEAIQPVDLFPQTTHVETVVLLGRENVDEVQYAYIDYETKDAEYLKGLQGSATYKEIKAWIKQEYDMNVTNLYIAQIKDKCGFAKRDNYNIGSESGRVPTCPPEKEKAILGAFKHFGMM